MRTIFSPVVGSAADHLTRPHILRCCMMTADSSSLDHERMSYLSDAIRRDHVPTPTNIRVEPRHQSVPNHPYPMIS